MNATNATNDPVALAREHHWMSARDDYPLVKEFEWGHRSGGDVARQQITALFVEVEFLRALATECWAWDEGDALPGTIPELLEALGECTYLPGSGGDR